MWTGVAFLIDYDLVLYVFLNATLDALKLIGAALIVTGLIFFIINNAFRSANFKRKGFFFLFVTLFFLLVFTGGLLYDLTTLNNPMFSWEYYVFPLTVIVASTAIMIFYFVRAKQYNHTVTNFSPKAAPKKEEYLYILYRFEDAYFLRLDKEKHSGDVVRFEKNIFFRDEMIVSHKQKYDLKVIQLNYLGTVNVERKKPITFYCYEIDLLEPPHITGLVAVNKFEIIQVDAFEFHKKILLRMLIKEPFNINL